MEMNLEDLAKRIQNLEDLEAIKRLKATYAAACDDKYNPKKMEGLFAKDAVWDGGKYFGRYESRKAITDFFAGISDNIVYALHYILMPNIRVDGNKAGGTWYLWMIATMKKQGGIWGAGVYQDKYVKIDGRWYFQETLLDVQAFTKYEDGWHKKPFSGVE
jgi:hypothetical protein